MTDPRLFRLRVHYGKLGRLALLSHLEVARSLERVVRRAQLPYAVTQGFSPHMRIAFGSALPVGVGSTCEIYDIFFDRYLAPQKALEALQKASADDLYPTQCEYIESKAPAASVAYPFSTYEALLEFDNTAKAGAFLMADDGFPYMEVPETITVVRKKKEKTLLVDDYLVGGPVLDSTDDGKVSIRFVLESKPTGSLRPDLFLSYLLEENQNNSYFADLCLISLTRIDQTA